MRLAGQKLAVDEPALLERRALRQIDASEPAQLIFPILDLPFLVRLWGLDAEQRRAALQVAARQRLTRGR